MANNTIEILTSINKQVSTIANYLAPKNGNGREATAKLSQGNLSSMDSGGSSRTRNDLSAGSLKEFIKIIGGLPGSVKAVAGLSGKTMNNFKSTMEIINKIMVEIDKTGKSVDVKNSETYIKNMNSLAEINKKSAKSALIAPAALLGAKLTYPVVMTYVGIFRTINKLMKINGLRTTKNIKALTKSVNMITNLMFKSALLIAVCAGMGVLVSKGGSEMIVKGLVVLGATLVTATAIIALVGAAGKMLESTGAIKGMKQVTILTFTSIGLVAACLALGALISQGDTQKILLNGLAVLGGTLATLSVIILLTGLLGKMMTAVGAVHAVKEITMLTLVSIGLVAMCFALGAIMAQGDTEKILVNGLIALGATLATLSVIILLAGLAGRLIKDTGAIKAVKEIVFMTLGAMAIVIASKFLGEFVIENHKMILAGLGATAGVMLGLIGIGWLAGKLLGSAKKGISALGVIELLAAGSMGLMFMAASLAKKLEGNYDKVTYALLMTTGTIVLFGGLAAAASLIMPEIIMGSVAIGLALLMAGGATKLMGSILDLDKKKDEYGVSWSQLAKDVLGINGVIAAFGLTAAAFSLLTIPILLATPAIAITIGFAYKVIGVVRSIVDIAKSIDEAGGIDRVSNVLNRDVPRLMKGFTKKNLDMDLSWFEIAKLSIKYSAVAKLSKNLMDTVSVVSKIANLGMMTEGGMIRPVLSIDKKTGKVIYGDPVDIVGVSKVICDTMRVFVTSMDYNFKDLQKMVIGAKMFEVLGTIANPISTFLDMLTGFIGGTDNDNNYTLTPVRIDSEGNIKHGEAVPVKATAESIVKAVSAFVSELYNKENAETWSEMVYGDRTAWQKFWGSTNTKTDAINEIGGMLGVFVSPVVDFINLISQFKYVGPGQLAKIVLDNEGNPKTTDTINVDMIAEVIGGSITSFVNKVYGMKEIDDFDDKTEQLEEIAKQVGNVGKALGDLSNNKRIDTVKLTNLYENFDKGSKSIIKIAGSISVFDKTIEANNAKRKKNIKELGKAIEELIDKFKDDSNSVRSLYGLVNALNRMDAEEISRKVGALKGNGASSGTTAQQVGRGGTAASSVRTVYSGLSQKQIEDAISNVLRDLVIQGKTNKTYSSEDEGINDILEAMNNMTFEIN